MTLKGKRKALNNNPEAQVEAIAEAFGGKVPTKPLARRYPGAAWQEGDTYHIVRLRKGKLYHLTANKLPLGISRVYRDALTVCGYLAQRYYRKVSVLDLQAAIAGPVSLPTLAEAQRGFIYWPKDGKQAGQLGVTTWEHCAVRPEGIKTGTSQGKPLPAEGYAGPFIQVFSIYSCIDLLRRAFQLDIQGGELREAFNKVVAVPKILVV